MTRHRSRLLTESMFRVTRHAILPIEVVGCATFPQEPVQSDSTNRAFAGFIRAPQGSSAEDQLLVQFQGMIAEYERAQILQRSRRGKRHRAHSGEVSAMSGAPYRVNY
jgi:hypothetical protein